MHLNVPCLGQMWRLVWACGTTSKVTGSSAVSRGPRRDDPAPLLPRTHAGHEAATLPGSQSGPALTGCCGSSRLSGLIHPSLSSCQGAWYTETCIHTHKGQEAERLIHRDVCTHTHIYTHTYTHTHTPYRRQRGYTDMHTHIYIYTYPHTQLMGGSFRI